MKETTAIQLRTVQAKEIMQKDVVTLRSDAPISEAVKTFEDYHISGAPVVDGAGHAIGVLSVADIARGDHVQSGRIESERYDYYLANPLEEERDDLSLGDEAIFGKEGYSAEVLGEVRVEDWMTARVLSVAPETDLQRVCEVMATENIHRVLVTSDSNVVGLVSTFDIVRYVAEHA